MVADKLVVTGADLKVIVFLPNPVTGTPDILLPVLTMEHITSNITIKVEEIEAIGQVDPIAVKKNSKKYSGSMALQLGEFMVWLAATHNGDGTQINNAILSIADTNIPTFFARTYEGLSISGEDIDIKRGSTETLVDLKWSAVKVTSTI